MPKILVVDDNPAVRDALELLFDVHGLAVVTAKSPDEALAVIGREDVAVVVQDMNFSRDTTSGTEGEELMHAIRRMDPDMPVLLMTAFTSLEMAVRLVKEGAADYVAKPWDDEKLVTTVKNLAALRALADENAYRRAQGGRARDALARTFDLRGLVYESLAMHEVVALAARVAAADVPVLVTGPNGSGKEKLAEIVQANSRRKSAPFVKVNAGGLPDPLLEAELFGADAGAYTGATKARAGRFEEANGGTIFLDEIGNLSMAGQSKLLRVLQSGEYQRLGSNQSRKADVRVISATNVDLPRAIREGTFREDLYFRLNVIELRVPPLRDRLDDVPPLAEHFLRAHAPRAVIAFTADARDALLGYDWPGNVRELENRIQRAVLVANGDRLTAADLGLADARPRPETPTSARAEASANDPLRAELVRALADAGGNVSRAAAALGISRQALYRRLERAGLAVERRIKE
jgi:DNA-binding NtrC family response regulator